MPLLFLGLISLQGKVEMKNTTIMQRLALLVLVPLLVLTLSSGIQVWQAWQSYQSAGQTRELITLSVKIGNLVHALQVERGSTAGFLKSHGQKFADLLPTARQKSDEQIRAFKADVATLDAKAYPDLASAIQTVNGKLGDLAGLRQRVDHFSVLQTDSTAIYSSNQSVGTQCRH